MRNKLVTEEQLSAIACTILEELFDGVDRDAPGAGDDSDRPTLTELKDIADVALATYSDMDTYPNADLCPGTVKNSFHGFVQCGTPCGGFLSAVLENNLKEAIGRADDENRQALVHIVAYVYQILPSPCWGSVDKVNAWTGWPYWDVILADSDLSAESLEPDIEILSNGSDKMEAELHAQLTASKMHQKGQWKVVSIQRNVWTPRSTS